LKDEIKRLASEVEKNEPKGIQLLVNNAGIARDDNTKYSEDSPDFKSAQAISDHLWKSEPENWQETFMTNIISQFFVAAGFLPLLAKGQETITTMSSSIVNITSTSGVMKGSSGGQFAYATSKAGFIHLTRMMATTFAEAKIRVNSIAPGKTSMFWISLPGRWLLGSNDSCISQPSLNSRIYASATIFLQILTGIRNLSQRNDDWKIG
jgi:NAD(P)-dependent dehydrogenase (short-subunit alcohol dehydrogenase family)